MDYWSGRVGDCTWCYLQGGKVDAGKWSQYVRDIEAGLKTLTPRTSFLTVAYQHDPPNAAQREELTAMVKRYQRAEPMGYHAFLIDSIVMSAVLTAVNWVVKKPITEKTFTDPNAALAWLQAVGNANVEVVRQSIASAAGTTPVWPELLASETR